ncbi:ESCRT-II complex subunit, partial [Chaetomidium leptoderma]
FPPEYSFPPFFTRQTNLTTHHAQLIKWSSLVLAYCRHHRLVKLSLSGNPTTTTSNSTTDKKEQDSPHPRDTTELFHNRRLNRQLSLPDIREVISFLRGQGRAEYIDSSSSSTSGGGGGGEEDEAGGGGGDMVWIYWRTPEEWAGLVEGWVEGTGQKGSVLTVYELLEGDGTRGAEFHGLDQELLRKALNVLVKRGKAQIFGQEDSLGVKFF